MHHSLSAIDLLEQVGEIWTQAKLSLQYLTGFDRDAMHVLVGVVLQISFAALLRTSVRSIWPWIILLVLGLGNEIVDFTIGSWGDPLAQRREAIEDLILTMMPATLLMLVARWRPKLLCK